mgnify:CR=1 FL=1
MRKICFISYRRQDSKIMAENIKARIDRRYQGRVFFDDHEASSTGIELGADFVAHIEQELSKSAVMLVIVGPEWQQLAQEKCKRKEKDWVLFEIESALSQDEPVPLIPVLIEGAEMPKDEYVPEGFSRANGISLRPRDHKGYEEGVRVLLSKVEEFMGPPDNPRHWNNAMLLTWLGSAIFLFLFGEYGPSDLQQASLWLAYLLLLPGVVPMVLAYAIPLDRRSVFIRSLILYLGLFVVIGLSLFWLEKWEPTVIAPIVGIALALCSGWLASKIAQVV